MLSKIRKYLIAQKRRQADVQFRTGFLYAIDRKLFGDSPALLRERDFLLALETPAFAQGVDAGAALPIPVGLDTERARRAARDA
jgi:hypothetical protein